MNNQSIFYRNSTNSFPYVIKYSIITQSVISFIIACVVIGIGSWLLLWTAIYNNIDIVVNQNTFYSSKVLLLIGGIFQMLTILFACFSATSDNSRIIITFNVLNMFNASIYLSAGACGFVANRQIFNALPDAFFTAITKYYGVFSRFQRNRDITSAIDTLQLQLGCCGVQGNMKSNYSWFIYKNLSPWYLLTHPSASVPYVPLSCCVEEASLTSATISNSHFINAEACVGNITIVQQGTNVQLNTAPIASSPQALIDSNPYLNQIGCIDILQDNYSYYTSLLGGLGIGVFLFQTAALILSCVYLNMIEQEVYKIQLEKIKISHKKTKSHTVLKSIPIESPSSGFNSDSISIDINSYSEDEHNSKSKTENDRTENIS